MSSSSTWEDALNTMISEALRLSSRLTRPLSSVIYHKTKGNPLFVSQLMISLNKEGLLRLSLRRRRWEWDMEKIQCQQLPDDVAKFLTNSLQALPREVKSSLCVLSCFGASSKVSLVELLERALNEQLQDNLDVAVKEGLIDKFDGHYRFSHDSVQEAFYNTMEVSVRCDCHFKYGMAITSILNGESDRDDSIIFTAVNQFNLAGPESVKNKSQFVIIARLNLETGKKAMRMSDYDAAYIYFDTGIRFLREKHWEQNYELSLELSDLAAKCALTNGDIAHFKLSSQQVVENARSFEDKLNVVYLATCAQA